MQTQNFETISIIEHSRNSFHLIIGYAFTLPLIVKIKFSSTTTQ